VGAENIKPQTVGTEASPMEGTKEMGYWEFKKKICNEKGGSYEELIHRVIRL